MQENEKTQPVLELDMEELETMEAPDFWGPFFGGVGSAIGVGGLVLSSGILT
ncbi:hypothetical protein ABIE67_009882 [Streptomyces sp. V4I8]|uniref:daptide-type RiPP n=1 Tax=Streptomyces sp. V4I8 TaxID=3156469 RepID=UPI0035128093